MTIPWKALAVKLGRWLLERGEEEAAKELGRRAHPSDPPPAPSGESSNVPSSTGADR